MKIERFLNNIEENTLLLTANKRLATWLATQYHDLQRNHHQTVWPTPDILPFESWLKRCFDTILLSHPVAPYTLLTPAQELAIWQFIIQNEKSSPLLHTAQTAHFAQQAWSILQQWQCSLEDPALLENPDSAQFIQFAHAFESHCKHHQLLDSASLTAYVTHSFESEQLPAPAHLLLSGFLEFTPAQQQLFDTLCQKGTILQPYETTQRAHNIQTVALADKISEITAMANWAKKISEQQPETTIGCIVPTLNQDRDEIERIFNQVFSHQKINISSGTPLLNEPIIHTAFTLLQLMRSKISIAEISHLLRSPFITQAEEEISARAALDSQLKKLGNVHYTLPQLLFHIKNHSLEQNLKEMQRLPFKTEHTPSSWAKLFSTLLAIMGWPGERSLDSREYQTIEQWTQLLTEFSKLDIALAKKINLSQAIKLLKQHASQTLFQPQTVDTKVQVLGILESINRPFSHIWVMGLDDRSWPASAKPNPLLPCHFQRQHNMPHASADRELQFSKIMMQQFLSNAETVTFSYPTSVDDQVRQASPLIIAFPQKVMAERTLERETDLSLEFICDTQAPPITHSEKIHGGTSIFKLQSACPFQAFAHLRLKAEAIDEPSIGLNAKERGSILHKALELFWRTVKDHNTLVNMSDDKLQTLLNNAITQAIASTLSHHYINDEFLSLEKKRLQTILTKWLMLEKTRKPFTIISQEAWQQTTVGQLKIRMRMDRLDKTEDNNYIVIDYKSGRTDTNAWFGDRPDEPQLPLYATYGGQPIDAISFAQIRPDEIAFKTVSKQKALLPNDKALDNWSSQYEIWKNTIKQLADAFSSGEATVDPKDPHKTCQYCKLSTLCRIHDTPTN